MHTYLETKFCTGTPTTRICWSSVGNLLHANLPRSRIMRWFLDFWKMCALLIAPRFLENVCNLNHIIIIIIIIVVRPNH